MQGNPSGGEYQYVDLLEGSSGTVPYVNDANGNGYGGGHNAVEGGSVECRGEISVIFEWVRNMLPNGQPDPLDIPPLMVVVYERSVVMATGSSGVDVSNGLGHSKIINGETQLATGTRLKVVTGDYEVMIKCTPTASAQSADSVAAASVQYSAKVYAPEITWTGVTRFFDDAVVPPDNAFRFLTGQKVRASLNFTSPGSQSAPSEFTFGSWQWVIPTAGMPFKDYVTGNYSGVKHELTAGDLDNPTFEFYTVDNGEIEQELSFIITPVGSTTLLGTGEVMVKSRKIESVRPELDSYDSGLGMVRISTYYSNPILGLVSTFGQSGDGAGIRVRNIKYKVDHFELLGFGGVVQLITPDRRLTVRNFDGSETIHRMQHSGTEGLDYSFPYNFDGQWSLPSTGSFQDTPFLNLVHLADTVAGYTDDNFRTWLMFRPLQKDDMATCWIPISRFDWYWEGTAQKQGRWSHFASDRAILQFDTNDLEHPEWNFFFPNGLFWFFPWQN